MELTAPLARILLRYGMTALAVRGAMSLEAAETVAGDPNVFIVVEYLLHNVFDLISVGIAATVSWFNERWYFRDRAAGKTS